MSLSSADHYRVQTFDTVLKGNVKWQDQLSEWLNARHTEGYKLVKAFNEPASPELTGVVTVIMAQQ